MLVEVIKKSGKVDKYKNVYDIYYLPTEEGKKIIITYPDELDYGVEAEAEYSAEDLNKLVVTYPGE